ncbi:hypothetical protein DCAR_0520613 [Daucus carota subsp. sativus]|uniref:Replication protein A 70 kDa DNA-binding subunit B/D first OB fold domain-containing protein n=1 Tax=Daucus carota subsp. sativus TaxID=79200 RepID=A0A162A3N9_DAUCS|nr:hypothetical protein DCAR_0520613 [Daucus carota subsp. sativus]
MALNRCYCIEDIIEPGMYKARIKVKVCRRWNGNSSPTESVSGISMFLTDSSNSRIYCWIPSHLADRYTEDLEEDKSYEIHNFMISIYISRCKWSVDDKLFMILMNSTIVLPLQIGDCFTTKETFNFQDLSQLDVIEILSRKGTMDFLINKDNEEEVFLDFEITDNIKKISIRFRNGLASLCNNSFNILNDHNLEPTTISISSCKMQFNRYTNDIVLIDMPSTRYFINYESQQDTILRQRYHEINNTGTSLFKDNF